VVWGLVVEHVEIVEITVQGPERLADLEALVAWFGDEPDLRGLIRQADAVPTGGELGAVPDTLVAAVGSGGAVTALAASLTGFFGQTRGAKVRLVVTRPDGTKVELDADRVKRKSVPELTAQVLGTGSIEQ
jgi:hypothetical protein